MHRWFNYLLLLSSCAAIAGFAPQGRAQKRLTVRILDGRTGEALTADNLEVRINRQQSYHLEFVKMRDDGAIDLTLPDDATALALRATYDNSMEYYVNCDVSRQKNTTIQTWFPVEDVLKSGLVMPDECRKTKDMLPVTAKPGEFVLYVRRRTGRDAIPF